MDKFSVVRDLSLMARVDIPAESMYERLCIEIKNFQDELDDTQEVGASLVSFNNNSVFHISTLGFHGKDMIIFYGLNNEGQKVRLLQHISQLNVLLIAVPRLDETKPAHRIGFLTDAE